MLFHTIIYLKYCVVEIRGLICIANLNNIWNNYFRSVWLFFSYIFACMRWIIFRGTLWLYLNLENSRRIAHSEPRCGRNTVRYFSLATSLLITYCRVSVTKMVYGNTMNNVCPQSASDVLGSNTASKGSILSWSRVNTPNILNATWYFSCVFLLT